MYLREENNRKNGWAPHQWPGSHVEEWHEKADINSNDSPFKSEVERNSPVTVLILISNLQTKEPLFPVPM